MLKERLKNFPRLYALLQRAYPFVALFPALFARRRGSWDHLRSTWSLLFRSPSVAGRPINVTVEPTNVCNLRCPVCETGSGELGRPNRAMTLAEFQTVIEKIGAHTNTLMFYFMGEPFLNRDAYRMIRIAKEAGIPWVTTCTNGDAVDPAQLVLSGLDEVSFQIGGMTQGTHQIYRVTGNFERVLNNLRETVRLKRKHGAKIRVVCGMILMRHNEHEKELFRQTMKEIGVDEAVIIDPCVRTVKQAHELLPSDKQRWIYDPAALTEGVLRPRNSPHNSCPWIYYSMVILANGDVVPCCRDAAGKFVMGNILTQGLMEIWNGDQFKKFRKTLLTNQPAIGICNLCSSYPASRVNG